MNINSQIEKIYAIEDDVRNHINTYRFQKDLISNINGWNQICSSLDVIGDTLLSIKGYMDEPYPENIGLKYIFTYGLLQSLFIQQDAIKNLTEAFNIEFSISEKLKNIRAIRNSAIGHPTKNNVKKEVYFNFISRPSLSKASFSLLKNSGENTKIEDIKIEDLFVEQLSEIINNYNLISRILVEKERKHFNKFKGKFMKEIFNSNLSYQFEKINSAIVSTDETDKEFGLSMLNSVRNVYEKFKQEMIERSELTDEINFELNEYFHAIDKLILYIKEDQKYDAYINLFYIRENTTHFARLAQEIDAEYNQM